MNIPGSYFKIAAPSVSDKWDNVINGKYMERYQVPKAFHRQYRLEVVPIANTAPKPWRRAIYGCATYFRRTFGYDFVQYAAEKEDGADSCMAYVWVTIDVEREDYSIVLGATCFRWRSWSNADPGWAMQWIWLHPYIRAQHVLVDTWPYFVERHGMFFVEPPLSGTMVGFLRNHAQCQLIERP